MADPDLPAHRYLDDQEITYERRSFPDTTAKGGANVAAALGCSEDQIVKTLIFQTGAGEPVLIMIGANRNAISGQLKRAVGSRNVKMAPSEVVNRVTGYQLGSIPPFHWQPEGFRSFIDEALMREEVLGVGAGRWGEEIMITPANLQLASHATVVNLTQRSPSSGADDEG